MASIFLRRNHRILGSIAGAGCSFCISEKLYQYGQIKNNSVIPGTIRFCSNMLAGTYGGCVGYALGGYTSILCVGFVITEIYEYNYLLKRD